MPRLPLVLVLTLLSAALISYLVLPSPGQAEAAPAAPQAVTLDFAPASLALAVGQTATVDIRALGAADLTAFEATLTFDPTRVAIDRVDRLIGTAAQPDPNRTWASLPTSGNPDVTYLQPAPGQAVFGAYSYGTANPLGPSDDLLLARVTVRGVANGVSSLQLTAPTLVNSLAQSTTPSVANATVTVGVPPTARPDRVGVFRPTHRVVYLKAQPTSGGADLAFAYGAANDQPIAGDWNGDGRVSLGVFRAGVFYLKNTNAEGAADSVFDFGLPGDLPVVGDWDGNGADTVGVFRNGVFYLRNSNANGPADLVVAFGQAGDRPLAGDWDGNGTDTVGVFRPANATVFLRHTNTAGVADLAFAYGVPSDKPFSGDWNGDGVDTVGVFRDGVFFLRHTNTAGVADLVFMLGLPGDEPLAGDWQGLP